MKKLLSVLLLAASFSFSAPVTYGTLSAWSAAGPVDANTITFNSYTTSGTPTVSGPATYGFSFQGWNLSTGDPANLLLADTSYSFYSFYNLGDGTSLASPQSPGVLRIVTPANVFGVGFYFGSPSGGEVTAVINGDVANAITISAPTLPGAAGFFGVRNDVAITSIQLTHTTASSRVVIDSVVFGGQSINGGGEEPPPSETPEASSAILIGTSLILLPLARKYAQRRNS